VFGTDRAVWALPIALAVMAVLMLRQIGNPDLGYPDADRLMLDGVFILDFLRDLPLTRIYDYAINYYAQYPGLSIGYRPPFFPLVEALFNAVLGVNTWSSRLAVLAFALVGASAWFALVRRVFDTGTAFWATLLLGTTPFVVRWGWYTMGEIPVLSMAMLCGYVFYRYTETRHPAWLYTTALVYGTAAWTKQTAVFIAIWFLLYLLFRGQLPAQLRRRETWIASALVVLIIAPLAAITLWLGEMNIAQSVGNTGVLKHTGRSSWTNLSLHLNTLYHAHLSLPVLLLSVGGMLWAALRRDGRTLYFALLIVGTYGFFTYLAGKNPRYPIFWIPAFCLFAVLFMQYLGQHLERLALIRHGSRPIAVLLLLLVGYQIHLNYRYSPAYASGYDTAARHVLAHSQSPTVFFDGYNNGYFTYFMRALDPVRSMYVLRGDKLLTSTAIGGHRWLEVHAQTRDDIQRMFDDYGVEFVVVESKDWSGMEIHQQLRDYLRSGPFRLDARIPIETNRQPLRDRSLEIYRYQNYQPVTAEYLKLRLPVVGKTIQVPFRQRVEALSGEVSAP